MTHRCAGVLIEFIAFFQRKIDFCDSFGSLRHCLGELTTQYPNFKLWDLPAIPFAKCGWKGAKIFEPERRRSGSPADFITLFMPLKLDFLFFLKTFTVNGHYR